MSGNSVERIWQRILNAVQIKLNESSYKSFVEFLSPQKIDGNIFYVNVNGNQFLCDWYKSQFEGLLASIMTEFAGERMLVEFVCCSSGENTSDSIQDTLKTVDEVEEEIQEESEDKRYTFDKYIVGSCNELAYSSSLRVAKSPGVSYNPLFIYGPSGVGKTHLLNAVLNYVKKNHKKLKTCFIPCEEFTNQYIGAIGEGKLKEFRRKYRKMDVLLIDDIHFLSGKERIQEEFFHTFNALFESHKQIVLVSDREPKDIKGLEQRLISRFEWGLSADIGLPDLETRIAILQKKSENHGADIPLDVLKFIAENINSNVRRLEGALLKLIAASSLYKITITVKAAEELLRSILIEEAKKSAAKLITVADIQKLVSEYFDVSVKEIVGSARPANIANARQVAMYLSRKLTTLSAPTIGQQFNRNHTTILHAVSAIGKKMEHDPEFCKEINMLERQLSS